MNTETLVFADEPENVRPHIPEVPIISHHRLVCDWSSRFLLWSGLALLLMMSAVRADPSQPEYAASVIYVYGYPFNWIGANEDDGVNHFDSYQEANGGGYINVTGLISNPAIANVSGYCSEASGASISGYILNGSLVNSQRTSPAGSNPSSPYYDSNQSVAYSWSSGYTSYNVDLVNTQVSVIANIDIYTASNGASFVVNMDASNNGAIIGSENGYVVNGQWDVNSSGNTSSPQSGVWNFTLFGSTYNFSSGTYSVSYDSSGNAYYSYVDSYQSDNGRWASRTYNTYLGGSTIQWNGWDPSIGSWTTDGNGNQTTIHSGPYYGNLWSYSGSGSGGNVSYSWSSGYTTFQVNGQGQLSALSNTDIYTSSNGSTFTVTYDSNNLGAISGSEGGYVINGNWYVDYSIPMNSSWGGPINYSLFGNSYSFVSGTYAATYDGAGNTSPVSMTEYYATSNGGSLTIGYSDPYPWQGSFNGNDPRIGSFSGTYSYLGNLTVTSGRTSPSFAPSQIWVNGIPVNWQSGSLDNTGAVVDYYYGYSTGQGDISLNISGDAPYVSTGYPASVYVSAGSYSNWGSYSVGGAFSVSDVTIETSPPHGSSAFGYNQVWVDGVEYDWQSGYTDSQNNSYDFYSRANGNSLIYYNGSFNTASFVQTGPLPPPTSASLGPPTIWINGTTYVWSSSSFNDNTQTSGTDNYTDGSGHWAYVTYYPGNNPQYSVSGYNPEWGWFSGSYDKSSNFFDVTGGDVRAADANGVVLYATAPNGLPPAIRVDSPSPLWQYLGQGSSGTYYYGGSQGGQRLSIDVNSQVALSDPNGTATSGVYYQGVLWTDQRDVRAVGLDGQPVSPSTAPNWGPTAVWVNGTLWRYLGTWTGAVTYSGSNSPTVADYYVGSNAGQRLSLDSSGNVTITNINGANGTGTYAGGVFTVAGIEVAAADANGNAGQPVFGPPAVWVNGIIFSFNSNSGMDIYGDGAGNTVQLNNTSVTGYASDNTALWSGTYQASPTDPANAGVFVVSSSNNAIFDVRAYNGTSPIQPTTTPQQGHPAIVKVNGSFWSFQGQTVPDAGQSQTTLDYYFGSNAGERLVIDANGNVELLMDTASPPTAASGFLSGAVFVVNGYDLRACNADNSPMAPANTPQWGSPSLWVEGIVWSFLGSVSDASSGIYADFYGGPNAGQIIRVDNASNVSGSSSGTYAGGVFNTGSTDIRAADNTGVFLTPSSPPSQGPEALRVGGLQWRFLGTAGGNDYYASSQPGQRLALSSNGPVIYSDRVSGVDQATGTYANGVYTALTGGASFNAGTIKGNLDILGDILSFGSLADDKNTTGVSISFADNISAPGARTANVGFTSSRSLTNWIFGRAQSDGGTETVPMMTLDSSHRLNIYSQSDPNAPAIILDPNGTSRFSGAIHIAPQGDLDMGDFTVIPPPQP